MSNKHTIKHILQRLSIVGDSITIANRWLGSGWGKPEKEKQKIKEIKNLLNQATDVLKEVEALHAASPAYYTWLELGEYNIGGTVIGEGGKIGLWVSNKDFGCAIELDDFNKMFKEMIKAKLCN